MELATLSGELCDILSNSIEGCKIDTGVISVIKLLVGLNLGPLLSHPLFFVEAESLALNVGLFHLLLAVFLKSLKLLLRNSLGDQLFTVFVSDGLHLVDDLVHQGLGEGRLIQFVVAEFPIANQVDDDITVELLSELSGKLESTLHVFHTVSVDVENWRVNCFGDVR